jgi:hypothetical protein
MNFKLNKFGNKVSIFLALIITTLGCNSAWADSTSGWIVKGNGGGIVEGQTYSLFNTDQKSYLRYKDRTGANLGWSSDPNNNFMKVKRQTPSNQPLKCEEKFGLFIEKEWPMYDKQNYGINLSTRTSLSNPSWYQWQFKNCGGPGAFVNLNRPVELFNTAGNMTLVGCERVNGVNLCWTEDVVTFRGQNYRKSDVAGLVVAGKVAKEILSILK